jgi:hypothetical protein
MFRYIEMYDAPAIMGQNNQDKQDSECGRGNHEKDSPVLQPPRQSTSLCFYDTVVLKGIFYLYCPELKIAIELILVS